MFAFLTKASRLLNRVWVCMNTGFSNSSKGTFLPFSAFTFCFTFFTASLMTIPFQTHDSRTINSIPRYAEFAQFVRLAPTSRLRYAAAMQVQLLPGAHSTWPVCLSVGRQPLKLAGR